MVPSEKADVRTASEPSLNGHSPPSYMLIHTEISDEVASGAKRCRTPLQEEKTLRHIQVNRGGRGFSGRSSEF